MQLRERPPTPAGSTTPAGPTGSAGSTGPAGSPGWFGVVVDVALGAALAATIASWAVAIAGSRGGGSWMFGSVIGLVVAGLALGRRHRRAAAAGAGLAVAASGILIARFAQLPPEPGLGTALGLAVLVASAVRGLPVRSAAAVAAAGLAVAIATQLAADPPASPVPYGDDVIALTVLNLGGWLLALAAGLSLRLLDERRREMAESVRRDERLDLARELHDVVAHHITGIVLQTQGARIVAHTQPDLLDRTLAGIETAGCEALDSIRRVVGLLRDLDDGAGLTAGPEQLSDLVKRFDGQVDQHRPTVRLRVPDGDGESGWPAEVTSTVYRIVQESLTNIARHAPGARSVTVDVRHEQQALTVEVTDDAPAAPARPHLRAGYGLLGMRERVETLGGTLEAGPGPAGGWSVLARLPVSAGRVSPR